MRLRIKELCSERGLKLSDLANKIGMDQSNLHSLIKNGNPTLGKLSEIADALDVNVTALLDQDVEQPIYTGLLYIDGQAFRVSRANENTVNVPYYANFSDLKKKIKDFVIQCLNAENNASFMARVGVVEVFNLAYCANCQSFILSICYSNGKMTTSSFDAILEYGLDGKCDIDFLYSDIFNTLAGKVDLLKFKSQE